MTYYWNPTLYRFKKDSKFSKLPLSNKLRYVKIGSTYRSVLHVFWKLWVSRDHPYGGYRDDEMEKIND